MKPDSLSSNATATSSAALADSGRAQPQGDFRSPTKRVWYDLCKFVCGNLCLVFFRFRVRGQQAFPLRGGILLVSNHQSHLDPVLIGVACPRRMNSVARETLFKVPLLRTVIMLLDAIPLDREGVRLAGVKEALRRLKQGGVVLIFPEGTRTADGRLQPLKPGFCALARRTRVPVMPVAIAGAFDAWPRWQAFPCPATIHVQFGQPIDPAEVAALDDQQLVAEVQARLAKCQQEAEAQRRRATPVLPALPQQT